MLRAYGDAESGGREWLVLLFLFLITIQVEGTSWGYINTTLIPKVPAPRHGHSEDCGTSFGTLGRHTSSVHSRFILLLEFLMNVGREVGLLRVLTELRMVSGEELEFTV